MEEILGEFATMLLNVASHKCDFYFLENGDTIEAMEIEEIDKMIYECLERFKKEH